MSGCCSVPIRFLCAPLCCWTRVYLMSSRGLRWAQGATLLSLSTCSRNPTLSPGPGLSCTSVKTWGAFGGCISLGLPDLLPALCIGAACLPSRAQHDRCQLSQCCSGGFRGSGCICSGLSANPRHCCVLSGCDCAPSCLKICIYSPISKYILWGPRWHHWFMCTHSPKCWCFWAPSSACRAGPHHCPHCSVHTAHCHILNSFPQPGSQLRNWRHTELPAQTSETSEKKKLGKCHCFLLADFIEICLSPPHRWASPADTVTPLLWHPAGRCSATAANRSTDHLRAVELWRSPSGLRLLAKCLQQGVFWDKYSSVASGFY